MFPIRSILFYQYPKFYSKLIISSWKTIEISNITSKRYLSNDSNEMAFDDMDDTYDETAYNWFRDSGEYQPDKHVPIDRRLAKNKPMHIEPSLKTTVILSRLPPSVTQESLSLAIGNDINHRKVELQPGCTFHIHNEPIAEKIASILENDFQCKVSYYLLFVVIQYNYSILFYSRQELNIQGYHPFILITFLVI